MKRHYCLVSPCCLLPPVVVLVALCSVTVLTGCGSSSGLEGPTGTVQGTLTYQGEPAPEGATVVFIHQEKGTPVSGQVGPEGEFTLKLRAGSQIPVGTYNVGVTPPSGEELSPEEAMRLSMKGKSTKTNTFPEIPQKYRDPDSSGVTFQVEEGQNTFELDMKGGETS